MDRQGGAETMMQWNDHFKMGIPAFDQEHRQIFKIAGQILEIAQAPGIDEADRMPALRQALNELVSCFSQHAAQEEAYMREIGYEGYGLHMMLHDDFRSTQMARYRQIVERDVCNKEEVWNFIGSELGWLLEHIATADMAIVGKSVLSRPAPRGLELAAVEREINRLLAATLDIEANAAVVDAHYQGEPLGEMICQKIVYRRAWRKSVVLCGVERSFVRRVARCLYGDLFGDKPDLVLSTIEVFTARFWITLSRQLTGLDDNIDVCESRFLLEGTLAEELRGLEPAISLLFRSDHGKFFVATDSWRIGERMKLA